MAKMLEQLIPHNEKDRKARPKPRSIPARQQRRMEVVFEYSEQPPAPKKAKTTAWKDPNAEVEPKPVPANPWKYSIGHPAHPEMISQMSVEEKIAAVLAKQSPNQMLLEEIQKKIDAGLASL